MCQQAPIGIRQSWRRSRPAGAIQEDTEETVEEAEVAAHRYTEERARLLAEVEALKQGEAEARKRVHLQDMQYAETRSRLLEDLESLQRKISLKRGEAEAARKSEEKQDRAMKKVL
jgi:hypothetical protein